MAKVEGYACDQCEKFSDTRAGWFMVSQGDEKGGVIEGTTIEVCSLDCVRKFALEASRALNPASSNGHGKGDGKEFKCDECGNTFDTIQGLTMHQTRKHRKPKGAARGKPRDAIGWTYGEHAHLHKYPSQRTPNCEHCRKEYGLVQAKS